MNIEKLVARAFLLWAESSNSGRIQQKLVLQNAPPPPIFSPIRPGRDVQNAWYWIESLLPAPTLDRIPIQVFPSMKSFQAFFLLTFLEIPAVARYASILLMWMDPGVYMESQTLSLPLVIISVVLQLCLLAITCPPF